MTSISRFRRSLSLLALGAVATGSCGPSLTTPSGTDISGTWVSPGPASGMTNITLTLSQAADGSLTGTYRATGTVPYQFCPRTGPCLITSTLTGANTVLQVFFYMKDAGTFTGQVTGEGTMKGAMDRLTSTQAVQFTRP